MVLKQSTSFEDYGSSNLISNKVESLFQCCSIDNYIGKMYMNKFICATSDGNIIIMSLTSQFKIQVLSNCRQLQGLYREIHDISIAALDYHLDQVVFITKPESSQEDQIGSLDNQIESGKIIICEMNMDEILLKSE